MRVKGTKEEYGEGRGLKCVKWENRGLGKNGKRMRYER